VHDPMTVIADLPRPWPTVRTVPLREQPAGFQHRHIGPVNIRAARFRCAHCDAGKIKDPPPSYHEGHGVPGYDPCPDCRGRGYNDCPLLGRLPYFTWSTWRFGTLELWFPSIVTLWHVDPEVGGDDDSCSRAYLNRWRDAHKDGDALRTWFWFQLVKRHRWWHVRHWRVQVRAWQSFNRWAWSRCTHCGGRFRWGYSPVSHSWYGTGPRWRRGEEDIYHHECSAAASKPDYQETAAGFRAKGQHRDG
jgi:hypothetical protein